MKETWTNDERDRLCRMYGDLIASQGRLAARAGLRRDSVEEGIGEIAADILAGFRWVPGRDRFVQMVVRSARRLEVRNGKYESLEVALVVDRPAESEEPAEETLRARLLRLVRGLMAPEALIPARFRTLFESMRAEALMCGRRDGVAGLTRRAYRRRLEAFRCWILSLDETISTI